MTLFDAMNKLNGVGQDASAANMAYQKSLDDVDAQIAKINAGTKGYIKTLDIGTDAGRTNRAMLDDLAGSNQAAAKAQFDLDGNTANYKATLEAGHKAVYDRAIALGANADEAKRIADEISKIPSETDFKVIAETQEAAKKVEELTAAIRATPDKMVTITEPLSPAVIAGLQKLGYKVEHLPNGNVRITSSGASAVEETLRRLTLERTADIAIHYRVGSLPKTPSFVMTDVPKRAHGGILPGAPSAVDNMYVHAAGGEFITNAAQTAIPSNRAALEFMNRGGVIKGYANGGYVTPVQYAPSGGGPGGSSVSVSPMVSLAGATLVMSVDGRQMTAVIQEQIVSASDARAGAIRRGVQ